MSKKILAVLSLMLMLSSAALAAETPKSQDVAQSPKVLAKVNGEEITEADVSRALQMLGQQAFMYGNAQGRKMILDELVSLKLFALEGKEKNFDNDEEFKFAVESFKSRMLAQMTMLELLKDVKITEDDAKKFYDEHTKEYFTEPAKIHASHILVSDDATSNDIITKIQADLKNGVSFDELAKKYSIEPGAASTGGDLGEFPRGVMVPEFEKTAFALKNSGDISEPVKTKFGWHIIKLHEIIPEKVVPYNDELKGQIIQELQNMKSAELLKKHSEELEKKYKVERF